MNLSMCTKAPTIAGSEEVLEIYRYRVSRKSKETFLKEKIEGRRALDIKEIGDSGLSELYAPYEIAREHPVNHTILFTLAGKGRVDLPGPRQELEPGSVCLLPAGLDHAYGTDLKWTLLWFHPLPTPFWTNLMPRKAVVDSAKWGGRLKSTVEQFLHETLQTGRINHLGLLDGYAQQIGSLLHRELNSNENPRDSETRHVLDRLWHLVSRHPDRDWNITMLARESGLSRPRLHFWVDRLYGHGPMEMVRRLRIEQASNLIQQNQLKLADIAQRVGYSSAYALSNAFKHLVGRSPRDYQRSRLPAQH